jgi:hypothetical protein
MCVALCVTEEKGAMVDYRESDDEETGGDVGWGPSERTFYGGGKPLHADWPKLT